MRYIRSGKVNPFAGIFAVLLAVGFMLFLPGCRSPMEPQTRLVPESGTGLLVLSLERQGARTILPDDSDFEQFDFVFTNVDTDDVETQTVYDWVDSLEITLPVGTWDLTVNILAGDYVVVTGTAQDIVVAETGRNAVTVYLLPVLREGSYGYFEWNVEFYDFEGSLAVYIYDFEAWRDGDDWRARYDDLEYTAKLPAGRYFVRLVLTREKNGTNGENGENGEYERTEIVEVLHVYQGLVSRFGYTFNRSYFPRELIVMMAEAWNGLGFDYPLNNLLLGHFTQILGVNLPGIFQPDLPGLFQLFGSVLSYWDDDEQETAYLPFPQTVAGLKVLVDAALVARLGQDMTFMNYNEHASRADVVNQIGEVLAGANDTPLESYSWQNEELDWPVADVLTVKIGPYTVVVYFRIPVTNVSIPHGTQVLTIGQFTTLTATVGPYNATNQGVSWAFSAPGVVTLIPGSGNTVTVNTVGLGTVTVSAISLCNSDFYDEIIVRVDPRQEVITRTATSLIVENPAFWETGPNVTHNPDDSFTFLGGWGPAIRTDFNRLSGTATDGSGAWVYWTDFREVVFTFWAEDLESQGNTMALIVKNASTGYVDIDGSMGSVYPNITSGARLNYLTAAFSDGMSFQFNAGGQHSQHWSVRVTQIEFLPWPPEVDVDIVWGDNRAYDLNLIGTGNVTADGVRHVRLQDEGSLTVANWGLTDEIRWYNGPNVHTGYQVPLTAGFLGTQLGTRFITMVAIIDGVPYSRRITLEVSP